VAVENWIDEIVDVWKAIEDPKGGNLRAFYVFKKGEFPEAISDFPCVLTYTADVRNEYSSGGPLIDTWRGVSEFHLVPDVGKQHYPYIMRWFALIRNAAAGSMQLNSKVAHFLLSQEDSPSIEGPVKLIFGSEAEHLGLIVHWTVKENVSGDYSPAA